MDSYSQQSWNLDDQEQQAAFQRETSKLWELMLEKEAFQFMTIEDVLEELQFLRAENTRLNRIIEEDIAEIKADISTNSENIKSVTEDVNSNREKMGKRGWRLKVRHER